MPGVVYYPSPVRLPPLRYRPPDTNYEVRVIGARPTPLRDLYHLLLRTSWAATFVLISAVFVGSNLLFACGYRAIGGVAHARPGSFADAFFFSVETMATIGYGAMYPESQAAHLLVIVEAVVGLVLTALATGLVFAKFSRPTARIVFARTATIHPMNGVPTLAFRVGNERANVISDAHFKVVLVRTEQTDEGQTFYRTLDLELARDHAVSLSRSWNVMHVITPASPLYGSTPEQLRQSEVELHVLVSGVDAVSMQAIHARHLYQDHRIQWGVRPSDVLSEDEDGTLVLDIGAFHDVEPTQPIDGFPYPVASPERVSR